MAPHLTSHSSSQLLATKANRLSLLRLELPNFNSYSKDLLGRFVLVQCHVLATGFLVVDIPYKWLELRSELQKSAYLKDKMHKLVTEELAK